MIKWGQSNCVDDICTNGQNLSTVDEQAIWRDLDLVVELKSLLGQSDS